MKLAIISSYSFKTPGGVQYQMIAQAKALSDLGLDVTLWGADIDSSFMPIPVPVQSLGAGRSFSGNGSALAISLSIRRAWALIRAARDYDVIHIHEPFYPQTLCMIPFLRTRVAATFHAQFETNPFYAWWGWLIRPVWQRLACRIAVSQAAADSVNRYFKGDMVIVPNGLMPASASADPAPEPPREKQVILFLGRPDVRKGLPVLLSAFQRLREALPDAELWVAGPGTEALTGERIRAFGRVTEAQKIDLFQRASCLCVPSLGGESFGVILLEAMAQNLPVIASDIAGYRTIITHDQNGVLVPPGDSVALCDQLCQILTKPACLTRLAQAGQKTACRFDWSRIVASMLVVYQCLVFD